MAKSHCDRACSRCVSAQVLQPVSVSKVDFFPSDGKKMSKSLRNYPDPNIVIDSYGADAVR